MQVVNTNADVGNLILSFNENSKCYASLMYLLTYSATTLLCSLHLSISIYQLNLTAIDINLMHITTLLILHFIICIFI